MVQLEILSGKAAGSVCAARRFPFIIGRGQTANLRLEGDGIWDRHATLTRKRAEGFFIRAESNALMSVNGHPTNEAFLRNGDLLEMGSIKARFWLAAPFQRGLVAREVLVWLTILLVTLGQIAIIYWIG